MTDLDHMSMQNVALFSGLIGALISSGLSYFIRATLDRHNLKEAELRITYVHFVKISQIVAIDAVAKIFLNAYATEELKAAIKSKDGLFEPSHAISVIIAQQIQKQTPETIKAAPGISFVTVYLKSLLESISESKLSTEQLSKLPKETVLIYSSFLSYLSHLQDIILFWSSFLEEPDTSLVTAESIHDQWLSITKFFEHARLLHSALQRAGSITNNEANALIRKQSKIMTERYFNKLKHKPKLEAALADANKAVADAK
jgi:hypothetical protein